MEQEPGDDYLRRLASFIRTNEKNLAEAGVPRRRRTQRPKSTDSVSVFNPLGWFGYDATAQSTASLKPVIISVDTHRLFYVLMRLEALGFDVGTLDVQIDSPSRPMSYVNLFPDSDKSDTLSLASFRSSLSAVSGLSLGAGWWGRPEPPSVDTELKYIFSSFTKLPALLITAPGRKVIAELANELPNRNALPLDVFKNLQSLECVDIDPRSILGWDRLATSLRSLKVKKSGLEDVSDIFIGAVVDDQARREGSASRKRRRRIPRGSRKDTPYYTTRLPDAVLEDIDAEESAATGDGADPRPDNSSPSPPPSIQLSSLKWAFLKYLSLSDNALTFFPPEPLPYLTSLTHLDLSSNLLVSVPSGLATLYNLVSLNLSDNMIDSVLGIYLNLGQILSLNLAHNRLESICGLERLTALERVDLRNNSIEESAEIGRLAVLPNIAEVWVAGNPFVELEEGYRVACFDYFLKERKTITLDGTSPGFYEKRHLAVAPPEQMSSSRPLSMAYSPPVVAVGHNHIHNELPATPSPIIAPTDKYPTPPSSNASPHLVPTGAAVGGKARRKKAKRIVEFDSEHGDDITRSASHTRDGSRESSRFQPRTKQKTKTPRDPSPQSPPVKKWGQIGTLPQDSASASNTAEAAPNMGISSSSTTMPALPRVSPHKTLRSPGRTRHSRYQTEFLLSSNNFPTSDPPEDITPSSSLVDSISPQSLRKAPGSATLSKLKTRRARVSASVYEPPTAISDGEGGYDGDGIRDNADAYRRRMEALKKDMGDGWLKVFSQSQMKSPSP